MVNASSYRVRVHTTTSDDTLLRTTCLHSQSINYYTRTLFLYPLGLHWRLRFSRNPPSLLGSFSTRLCVPASCFTTNIHRHRRSTITVYVYVYDINIITTTTTKRPLLRLATDKYTEYVGPGPGSVIWYIYIYIYLLVIRQFHRIAIPLRGPVLSAKPFSVPYAHPSA